MDKIIQQIRAFNRYYTGIIGVLNHQYLNSPFTLPEARVLYEIASNELCTAKLIASVTKLDKGYLSRILKQLYVKKYIIKQSVRTDARKVYLKLTSKGKKAFSGINKTQNKEIKKLILNLTGSKRKKLTGYMRGIKELLYYSY